MNSSNHAGLNSFETENGFHLTQTIKVTGNIGKAKGVAAIPCRYLRGKTSMLFSK